MPKAVIQINQSSRLQERHPDRIILMNTIRAIRISLTFIRSDLDDLEIDLMEAEIPIFLDFSSRQGAIRGAARSSVRNSLGSTPQIDGLSYRSD